MLEEPCEDLLEGALAGSRSGANPGHDTSLSAELPVVDEAATG
jgi:hypothetical protein